MRAIEDALERTIDVPERPQRIVSLVPSVTELLFDLGAGEQLCGISNYCTEPRGVLDGLPRIGGQKNPEIDAILRLQPDLVLAVKEENLARDVAALEAHRIPVYVADVRTIEDALALIGEIGDLVDAPPGRQAELRSHVAEGVAEARRIAAVPPRRLFVPVWRDPWITISADTYMHEVLHVCGGVPLRLGRPEQRYPKVDLDEVLAARPDLILLPDEPYAFGPSDVAELSNIAPTTIVDGKLLGWYGRRTGEIAPLSHLLRKHALR